MAERPYNKRVKLAGARTARARATGGGVTTDKERTFVRGADVARSLPVMR